MITKNVLIIKNGKCKTYVDTIIGLIDNTINANIIHCSKINSVKRTPDFVIILGGIVSVRDLDVNINLQNVLNYIKICDRDSIPVLGICLGCQLIARYLGSNIKKAHSSIYGFKNIKINKNVDCDDICKCILKNNKYYISLHDDYIDASDNINIMATYNEYPYYIKNKTLYGVQFHPDIVEDNVKKFAKCFGINFNDRVSIKEYFINNKEDIVTASRDLFEAWFKMNKLH